MSEVIESGGRRTVGSWIEEGWEVLWLQRAPGRLRPLPFLCRWHRGMTDFHEIRGMAAKQSRSLGYSAEIERLWDWIRNRQIELQPFILAVTGYYRMHL